MNEQYIKGKGYELSVKKILALTLLASFLVDIIIVILSVGINNFQPLFPRTIPFLSFTFFTILLMSYPIYFVTKLRLNVEDVSFVIFFFTAGTIIFWSLAPDFIKPLKANYLAVSNITIDMIEEEHPLTLYNISLRARDVYSVDELDKNPQYQNLIESRKIDIADNRINVIMSKRFLFWRTSLLFGHFPLEVGQVWDFSFSKPMLFLSIGPTILLESFIRSLTMHFPMALIFICSYNLGPKFFNSTKVRSLYYRIRY